MVLTQQIDIAEVKKELVQEGKYDYNSFTRRGCEKIVEALNEEGMEIGLGKDYCFEIENPRQRRTCYRLTIQKNSDRR